jgi:hypothetical protein
MNILDFDLGLKMQKKMVNWVASTVCASFSFAHPY